jgi:hypothetical protein
MGQGAIFAARLKAVVTPICSARFIISAAAGSIVWSCGADSFAIVSS